MQLSVEVMVCSPFQAIGNHQAMARGECPSYSEIIAFDNSDQKVDAEIDGRKVDQSQDGSQQPPPPKGKRARLRAAIWDTWDKSPEERRLVQKVDWWLLSYACIAYFIKALDQGNTFNAYVSGMKEALDLKGNDFNYLTTYWNIGYIIGQIPSQLILIKIRPSIWLPGLELLWSCLVMALAGAKNVETIFALRFFIGLFEASAYPGVITLLGNWYTPQELAKRAAIFQASSSAANMFSGYLHAALYSGMNRRAGLAAWQWLLIYILAVYLNQFPNFLANNIRRLVIDFNPDFFNARTKKPDDIQCLSGKAI
ncbi:major facilitator superfamily domain-containing protein [Aspergillus filifer]